MSNERPQTWHELFLNIVTFPQGKLQLSKSWEPGDGLRMEFPSLHVEVITTEDRTGQTVYYECPFCLQKECVEIRAFGRVPRRIPCQRGGCHSHMEIRCPETQMLDQWPSSWADFVTPSIQEMQSAAGVMYEWLDSGGLHLRRRY